MKILLNLIASVTIMVLGVMIKPTGIQAQTSQGNTISPQKSNIASAAIPTHLAIPVLGIDTTIQSVGKDKVGNMDVPSNATEVAWYNLGALPGEAGNAVISGHYDDKKGPAIFYKLGKLKVGDDIRITDTTGVVRLFKVMEAASYPYNKAPLNKIFGFDLHRDLNLITCMGRWNPRTHTYSQRLVVYARLVE